MVSKSPDDTWRMCMMMWIRTFCACSKALFSLDAANMEKKKEEKTLWTRIGSPLCLCGCSAEGAYHFFCACPRYLEVRNWYSNTARLHRQRTWTAFYSATNQWPEERDAKSRRFVTLLRYFSDAICRFLDVRLLMSFFWFFFFFCFFFRISCK